MRRKAIRLTVNRNLLSFDDTMKDAEKYKQDKFIKKACTWLKDRVERFVVNTPACNYDYKQAVEDFKTYMKGE